MIFPVRGATDVRSGKIVMWSMLHIKDGGDDK